MGHRILVELYACNFKTFHITTQYILDTCETCPCHGESICHDLTEGYRCLCYMGWTGTTCETGKILSSPCCFEAEKNYTTSPINGKRFVLTFDQ